MPRSINLTLPAALALAGVLLAVPVGAQDATPDAEPSTAPASAPATPGTAPALAPPEATPNPVAFETPTGDGTGVRLTTDLGDVVIGLFTESAPVAAENFLNLVEAGFYDGVGFHRVAPGFVLQGGDPEGTGAGGPGYTIADEEVVGRYGRGIVAMARTPAPDSQGSQFFVVLDDAAEASLDAARTYAIFGRVLEGMDVVDAIVARGPASDQVEDPVRIQSASIEQVELPAEPTPPPPSAAEIAADALAAQVPEVVAGIELLDRASFSSDVILAQVAPDILAELDALAEAQGTDLERLAIARAAGGDETSFATIVAASIEGVAAEDALALLGRLVLGLSGDAVTTTETIAGREVTRIELAPDQVAYALAGEVVVWFLVADEGNLEGVISSLP